MSQTITFKGKTLTLLGRPARENTPAPDATLTNRNLEDVFLSQSAGKIRVLTTFLSLDTPVCETQVETFNKKAVELSKDIVILAVSNDLPFAQSRFCQAHGISSIDVLSDYRYGSVGYHYGLRVKELNLLARAVLVIDKTDRLRYIQIVDEATHPPDYDALMEKLQEVLKNPGSPSAIRPAPHCLPCETGTPPLTDEEVKKRLTQLNGWNAQDSKKIEKIFKRAHFADIKDLIDIIALVSDEQGHHPTLTWTYNKLNVVLTTHASGGLTNNDFILAGLLDEWIPQATPGKITA